MNDTHTRLPKEPTARKVRADAIAIMAMGVAASVSVISLAVNKYLSVFVPGGIAWNLPVKPQPGTAEGLTIWGPNGPVDAPPVSGSFTNLQVIVTDVNSVSTVCLAASIVSAAITGLLLIACTVRLAWLFQQGRFFTLPTSRALRTLNWSLVGGGVAAFVLWNFGSGGVEAALQVKVNLNGTFEWWGWYWIFLFAGTAFGLVDIALRRAIRLQHETEGLV